MLIEFRVANFRSFKDEQVLSLVASNDNKHPGNLIPCDKFHLAKAAGVFGANASGKSNLLKAMRCMRQIIRDSATKLNAGDKLPGIAAFRLDAQAQRQPSVFETVVMVEGIRYQYGFSATTERIHDEWLKAWPKGKEACWLERRSMASSDEVQWNCRGPLEKEQSVLREKTRENCLALSRGAELNIAGLAQIYLYFRQKLWVFDLASGLEDLTVRTAHRLANSAELQRRVGALMRHADVGIDGLTVTQRPADWKEMSERVRLHLLAEGTVPGQEGLLAFTMTTSHRVVNSEDEVQFDLRQDESNGTQRFFAVSGPLLDALEHGATVVVDEFDASMHPLLSRKLVELFQSPGVNKKGAQLIFATHDSTLMDQELLRRDQIWLCEKNREGATEIYSLYDFDTRDRPRSTTALQRNYLAGRYGGVPTFGRTLEDLEIE